MGKAKQIISSVLLNECLTYLEKDPMNNLSKLLNWSEKLAKKANHKKSINLLKEMVDDSNSNGYILINKIFKDINNNVRKKSLINFFVNSTLVGIPIIEENEKKT
ncbi:hypothetical protein [Thermohalobacter berrensis]|uniref:hypothetical protein n=1 Tax=Thermohalobacter berrensis TaxID=99594 RepID=UPI00242CF551|nr:hypothetical protein [Thermohalobacter berrensis]